MTTLVSGLLIFFAAHTFTMFRDVRQRVVDRLGVLPFRGIFSLFAVGGLVLIVMGFADAPRTELWTPSVAMRTAALVLMVPVFILLVAANLPGHIKARVKNPMLIGLKTWAFAHLLANGDLASALLFGSFLSWAIIDLIAVKRSNRSAVVATPKAGFDALAVILGLALYGFILFYAHPWISGVPLVS